MNNSSTTNSKTKNNNLFRRLSVALNFNKDSASSAAAAAQPGPVVEERSVNEPSALSTFLRTAKESFIKDVRDGASASASERWTVVLGNEAADLDSIASSIGYAYLLSHHQINKSTAAVPLIQVRKRTDLALRPENLYAFKRCGLSDELDELLTLEDVSDALGLGGRTTNDNDNDKNAPIPFTFPARKFALVDHNRLGDTFSSADNPTRVVSVIDHHEDEKLYLDAEPRIVQPCGSCASLVAARFFSSSPSAPPPSLDTPIPIVPTTPFPSIPQGLSLLLLFAILIDTNGLKPGGKATRIDVDSARSLLPLSSLLAPSTSDALDSNNLHDANVIKDLTKALRDQKADVSGLSGYDLLRRDYKEYTCLVSPSWATTTVGGSEGQTSAEAPSMKLGLSTVPSSLETWGAAGRRLGGEGEGGQVELELERAAVQWMRERGLGVLGVLTSYREDKGKQKIFAGIVGKKGKEKGKGKHKREQAWFVLLPEPKVDMDALATGLFGALEGDERFGLKVYKTKKFSKLGKGGGSTRMRVKVYKQKNVDASRKEVAPFVRGVVEGPGRGGNGEVPNI